MQDEFLAALAEGMPSDQRLILCGFVGDPGTVGPNAWRPRPWKLGADIPFSPKANAYTTVSSFGRAADNSFRRRTETFAAGRALMVDDVGTKVDPAKVEILRPSAVVETSPGNFQWWYFLDEPEEDGPRFDSMIRAFIRQNLLGADPGMSGITRVGRIPGFVNGKPAYDGWRVELRELNGRRFSFDELKGAWGLELRGRIERQEKLHEEEAIERLRTFKQVHRWLTERRMLKRDEPDLSGWTEMSCPWKDKHTRGVDTGAAIREPSPENDYHGAFRCHHGHCADQGWAELTEWINETSEEELNHANLAGAGAFEGTMNT